MTVEGIIRKHMEAMHDELREWLNSDHAQLYTSTGFAYAVIDEIDRGTMYSSEYMDWYKEEVGQ